MGDSTKRRRIWVQGATDESGHKPYLDALLPHVAACADPAFDIVFHTLTPSVTSVHALTEMRFARGVVRAALQAEREGWDAFYMNHFQDVGLMEARAAVGIPVLGLGETTLLHACTLGRRLGLIAIHPAFIAHHAEQVARYGLGARVVGIRSMHASIAEHMAAFSDPAKKAVLQTSFETQARILLDAGADVIVPTGGIPMMMFGAEHGANIDGAPIVDGVAVIVKAAEMAVRLRELTGLGPSRALHSGQALPTPAVVEEFLTHG